MDVVLTEKQLKLLRFIAKSIDESGCQPSYRDMCDEFGWSSPNAVVSFMNALEKKGVVERLGARAIKFDWRYYLPRRAPK